MKHKKLLVLSSQAALAQLGERQTEDLKAPCSIHGGGIAFQVENFNEYKTRHLPKTRINLLGFYWFGA